MPTSADEVVVGANGQVYVGPLTATAPADSDSTPDTDFVELGYTSEEGVTVTDSKDIEDINAWQSFYPVRKVVTGKTFQVSFALRQWNADTVPFAFGGGAVTGSAGDFEYEPPPPEEIDERSVVIDWQDGDDNFRLYIPRGIVAESVESNVTRTSAADLPITFAALPVDTETAPYTLFTNSDAFAPAGS